MRAFLATPARRDSLIGIALLAALIMIPLTGASRYALGQIVLFMIYAAIATHWNLLFGYAGIFSLAHLTLFGIGAYAMAMLNFYMGVSIWLAIPMAGVVAVCASLILGFATLRLSGIYMALLTLAFAQVVYVLIVTDTDCFIHTETACRLLTGGAAGFYGFEDFGTRHLFKSNWFAANYYIVLFAATLTVAAALILMHSGFGVALMALRDNPLYAQALGVNKLRLRLQVFAISAFFTGMMGAIYAGHLRTVSPTVMSLSKMLYLIAAVVLGGAGRSWGAVLGLAVLMLAAEVLDFGSAQQIGIGVILLLTPILFRRGLLGLTIPAKLYGHASNSPNTQIDEGRQISGGLARKKADPSIITGWKRPVTWRRRGNRPGNSQAKGPSGL